MANLEYKTTDQIKGFWKVETIAYKNVLWRKVDDPIKMDNSQRYWNGLRSEFMNATFTNEYDGVNYDDIRRGFCGFAELRDLPVRVLELIFLLEERITKLEDALNEKD